MREERPRPRDLGLVIGGLPPGLHNAITDVAEVRVGHRTVWRGGPEGDGPVVRTGVTAVLPHPDNLFRERFYAATSVFNGYGEMTGSRVIDEWGLLGTPILLTGTVGVGRVYDAAYAYMMDQDPDVGSADVAIPVIAECWDGCQPEGSCIAVVATDASLHPLQLRRLARRVDVGLGRTGSVGNDGSGEMAVAFSTANRIPRGHPEHSLPVRVTLDGTFLIPPEDPEGDLEQEPAGAMDLLFEAVAEATEEAALNALFRATTTLGRNGHVLHALPIERVLSLLESWRPL